LGKIGRNILNALPEHLQRYFAVCQLDKPLCTKILQALHNLKSASRTSMTVLDSQERKYR